MPEPDMADLSDRLTRALITGNFDLYAQVIALPMQFTPRGEKPYVLHTEAELREDFEVYVGIIRTHGVTDIYRKLLTLRQTPTGVEARCLTHILVRANLLTQPFETRIRAIPTEGGWKIAEIESSEGHIHWSMGQAEIADGSFKPKE
ncbi:hypothetical protein [Stagnihabitans tardus]|uniref:Uncharacterized protein n=1 Tax=Stagnihabitans tardus TaxID=2699202 RepID=A0AAE4Y9F7_9RHOB|nr:hypothetical protein [Stagnihabitans tardus]NBZ88512.1 hypothetical protein [Stagnihabitans tardus]